MILNLDLLVLRAMDELFTMRHAGSPNVPRVSPNHNPRDVNVPLYGHTALRWAFGVNMRASELGWFPMNYLAASTRALMTV